MIIFDKEGLAEVASRNFLSLINRSVCMSNVQKTWEAVTRYIHDQLRFGHGVKIPGLVTIGFKTLKHEYSHQMYTEETKFHMLISPELVNMYALKASRPLYTLGPITTLNLSKIAEETGMPRKVVEICIDEVIQAFRVALIRDNHVEFHFEGIGKMVVCCNVVTTYFHKSFVSMYSLEKRQKIKKDILDYKC